MQIIRNIDECRDRRGAMTTMHTLNEKLHAAGHRLTAQRRLVLEIIEESQEHLDAEGIWQRAMELHAQINLATVYRTLAVLKEMGLVQQRYFAREHKREVFESALKPEHFHFTCLGCGEVIEFQTSRIHQARSELSSEVGVDITHACVCFEGYCSTCLK